jgi:hypothetical protein
VILIADRRPVLKKRHLAQAPQLWTGNGIGEYEEVKRKLQFRAISSLKAMGAAVESGKLVEVSCRKEDDNIEMAGIREEVSFPLYALRRENCSGTRQRVFQPQLHQPHFGDQMSRGFRVPNVRERSPAANCLKLH